MSAQPEQAEATNGARPTIHKRDFIRQIAKEADLPMWQAARAYEAFIKMVFANIHAGNNLSLTGFGKFYEQQHEGHTVFGGSKKEPYKVLKFGATREVNKLLELDDSELKGKRIPSTHVRWPQLVSEAVSRQVGVSSGAKRPASND